METNCPGLDMDECVWCKRIRGYHIILGGMEMTEQVWGERRTETPKRQPRIERILSVSKRETCTQIGTHGYNSILVRWNDNLWDLQRVRFRSAYPVNSIARGKSVWQCGFFVPFPVLTRYAQFLCRPKMNYHATPRAQIPDGHKFHGMYARCSMLLSCQFLHKDVTPFTIDRQTDLKPHNSKSKRLFLSF